MKKIKNQNEFKIRFTSWDFGYGSIETLEAKDIDEVLTLSNQYIKNIEKNNFNLKINKFSNEDIKKLISKFGMITIAENDDFEITCNINKIN